MTMFLYSFYCLLLSSQHIYCHIDQSLIYIINTYSLKIEMAYAQGDNMRYALVLLITIMSVASVNAASITSGVMSGSNALGNSVGLSGPDVSRFHMKVKLP